jgi:hypothetical protein
MVAVSRWVRYSVSATTGFTSAYAGIRGLVRGTANTADSFTIPGSANNQIKVNVNSGGLQQITLTSGTGLDPRFVARDMQRKIQAAGAGINTGFEYCKVEYSNWKSSNGYGQFMIKSGTGGSTSTVAIAAGDSSVLSILGLNSTATENGVDAHEGSGAASNNAAYTGSVTISGTYRGAFDDEYNVVICNTQPIGSVSYGGGNTYGVANAGVATPGGFWNAATTETYTVTISTSNGAVVGAGTGNVPTFTVTSTQSDTVSTPQELLYANEIYYIGTRGLTLRFTDAPFGHGDTFTIVCTAQTTVDGSNAAAAVATAKYHYRSRLGDDSTSATTTSTVGTALGRKGVTIAFSNSGSLTARDEFRVICRGPTPEAYGVTSMVYGNVTVTTESPVKAHQFEIMSGAVDMSSVKFSLQSHGTFAHHDAGNSDTFFRFGTAGFGQKGDGTAANNGVEWTTNVLASDLATAKSFGNTGAPIMLAATVPDLAVVSSADDAEDVGNRSLVSDFIWTNIRLGAEESGANSTINYRLYFDYV